MARFTTTHWSCILAAAASGSTRSAAALAELCRTYWYPLYVYVRRLGHPPQDAKDLTQEFFARMLEKRYLHAADPAKGRFRSFLLTALKGFLANEWDKANRQKRGGGLTIVSLDECDSEGRFLAEPLDQASPEKAYERRWAMTLLERAVGRLEQEYSSAGRGHLFQALKPWITGEEPPSAYEETAARLRMTQGALRVAVHRLRQRYREILRGEIAETVASPEEIDAEIHYLFAALSG